VVLSLPLDPITVSASPHAVDKAMKTSRKIDEAKIKRLLKFLKDY
jgi:hypothetical protein